MDKGREDIDKIINILVSSFPDDLRFCRMYRKFSRMIIVLQNGGLETLNKIEGKYLSLKNLDGKIKEIKRGFLITKRMSYSDLIGKINTQFQEFREGEAIIVKDPMNYLTEIKGYDWGNDGVLFYWINFEKFKELYSKT